MFLVFGFFFYFCTQASVSGIFDAEIFFGQKVKKKRNVRPSLDRKSNVIIDTGGFHRIFKKKKKTLTNAARNNIIITRIKRYYTFLKAIPCAGGFRKRIMNIVWCFRRNYNVHVDHTATRTPFLFLSYIPNAYDQTVSLHTHIITL